MAIMEGVTAIKATLELAKLTTDLVKRPNIDAAKVQGNLHEMLIHSVNAQSALNEAQQEIGDLRRQLDQRDALEALKADMEPVPDGGFLIRRSERDRGLFNPYCPVGFGREEKAVPLVPMANGYYSCAIHEAASYKTQAYREEQKHREAQWRSDESTIAIIPGRNSWMG
jgi:hypothetical protein